MASELASFGRASQKRILEKCRALSLRARVADAKAAILNGSLNIYSGPMRDNQGKVAIPAGKILKIEDTELDRMDLLVEGVDGSAKG